MASFYGNCSAPAPHSLRIYSAPTQHPQQWIHYIIFSLMITGAWSVPFKKWLSLFAGRCPCYIYNIGDEVVACNLRTCVVCRLHGAKYAVCRLHGTQSADCMVTVQTKDPSKTCDSFSKFQRNLRFSARINFLTKLPNLKENNLCLFDNGYYSFSCL